MPSLAHSSARRPGSLKPSTRLPSYLVGALGAAACLSASQAEAAVTAVSFGFGPVLDASDDRDDWSVGGFGTINATGAADVLLLGALPYTAFGAFYQNESYAVDTGLPSFFATGTVFGSGGNGSLGTAYFWRANESSLQFGANQLNKNIGFQTTSGNWGWANVSWNNTAKALTVNSAYVESVSGQPITAGDIGAAPEPSRALLALAGLAGVALRRRRKQAA